MARGSSARNAGTAIAFAAGTVPGLAAGGDSTRVVVCVVATISDTIEDPDEDDGDSERVTERAVVCVIVCVVVEA
ncbi:hypothetical protein FOVG_18533 [Fusarium oxysporum f. sp. pisi HDV247]|uniref:Uncharacterized protein n=1 Tax=Fusarium oxysporum f. sp. pisi HDV247 TaxID=1080344 RepID=W9NB99_FUSOX|nr:hypothetical protein FOVG_18533 [Fusarium oxysporum f. sp. pisi HDV247]